MNVCTMELPVFVNETEECDVLEKMIWEGVIIFFKGRMKVRYDESDVFHKLLVAAFLSDHWSLVKRDYMSGGLLSCHMPYIPFMRQKISGWRPSYKRIIDNNWRSCNYGWWSDTKINTVKLFYLSRVEAVVNKLNVGSMSFSELLDNLNNLDTNKKIIKLRKRIMNDLKCRYQHRIDV